MSTQGKRLSRGTLNGKVFFRRFINTHGRIDVTNREITVRFENRTHNPVLKEAGFEEPSAPVPWPGGRGIRLVFP